MKGYFRRAEIQAAAGEYDLALLLYGKALQLQPRDINILNAAKRVAALSNRETMCEWKIDFHFCNLTLKLIEIYR